MKDDVIINTLQDIVDVVDKDNVDMFLADFSNWIKLTVELKAVTPNLKHTYFKWLNDGKHEAIITLRYVPEIIKK